MREQFLELNILRTWKISKCYHHSRLGVAQKTLHFLLGVSFEENPNNSVIFL